jgi:hypothetical protein
MKSIGALGQLLQDGETPRCCVRLCGAARLGLVHRPDGSERGDECLCKPSVCLTRRLAAGDPRQYLRRLRVFSTTGVCFCVLTSPSLSLDRSPLHSPLIGLRAFCCQLTSSRLWRDVSLSSKLRRHRKPIAATASVDIMYQITNIYALAAFGTIGGALFGFDVSSMSAWIDRDQYLKYFDHPDSNTQGGVSSGVPYACCRQVQH